MKEAQKQIKDSENESVKFKFSLKTFNRFLYLAILMFGISYLLCINDLAIKGFKLNELKTNLNKITEANTKYELEIMGLKSYNNISQRAKDLKMVNVAEAKYLDAGSMAVAKNQ